MRFLDYTAQTNVTHAVQVVINVLGFADMPAVFGVAGSIAIIVEDVRRNSCSSAVRSAAHSVAIALKCVLCLANESALVTNGIADVRE